MVCRVCYCVWPVHSTPQPTVSPQIVPRLWRVQNRASQSHPLLTSALRICTVSHRRDLEYKIGVSAHPSVHKTFRRKVRPIRYCRSSSARSLRLELGVSGLSATPTLLPLPPLAKSPATDSHRAAIQVGNLALAEKNKGQAYWLQQRLTVNAPRSFARRSCARCFIFWLRLMPSYIGR
ncbi:hypothetical protein AUEXF2481DRAFT_345776 [Aureobasidium subglaciale EXF-2481]|uniref:Uncharacterized protein n=1 Tax=Aureobasidium subglaciale (strain EXF-2481) TaxID=1043005 RepID=A0A074Y5M0_AURSE|nr:uncharacterized protein AUEXF2481DRAFT_345776 [Aureobasidium subglaciale EXF-2481]KEQ93020.1 hypothetical protein AUEXF2481DRAFT_345776 [Aureobasidium subglaciale EXF-2481]